MSESLEQLYLDTRAQSVAFCAPLVNEDFGLQAADFASPPKWHLAHTSWFFETFILKVWVPEYQSPDAIYEVLFNSYYNGIGEQFPRPQRGLLSRPTVADVMTYREHVDAAMMTLLSSLTHADYDEIAARTRLGIEHECQHQELFFTDLKYSLAVNPMFPQYTGQVIPETGAVQPLRWQSCAGGLVETGYCGEGFCFDNELPRHKSYLEPFEMADRLITNQEFQAFIDDGGYCRPELWLADGWSAVQSSQWRSPLYWVDRDAQRLEYTLHGLQPRQASAPVCHISAYEADAYANWAGARLPTEQEWEYFAAGTAPQGRGVDDGYYHPAPADRASQSSQLYDSCWQWTRSAYSPYPGYSASPGAIGEYNGKFMSNQWVLRGGSCVSKPRHLRLSYRNFFYPQDRWQFTGIRLARSSNTTP
tara:strand:+ start:451480 stop:452736 length:1257 start_codon:yes stop_codon:yes gene_type:complete